MFVCLEGQCCESDLCNKCPMWELLNQPLEVVRQVQFPPECNITIPEPTEECERGRILGGGGGGEVKFRVRGARPELEDEDHLMKMISKATTL